MKMFVALNVKTVPIISTRSKTGDVRAGVPCDTVPLGEPAESRGVGKKPQLCTEVVRPSAEVPGLTRANLRHLKGKNPLAAALASIVSSLPPFETTPTPGVEVAIVKVEAWERAAMNGKGEDAALGTMFGAT